MQINRTWAALKRALRPSRIARSVSAVLVLTLIQTVALPILDVGTPKASASTLYDTRSNFLQWDTWRSAANHVPYWNESNSEIVSNSSAIQFTQNVNFQSGFAWNTQTVSISRDFTMSGNYFFGQGDGADGIIFFMRPLSTWPNGGTAGSLTGVWSNWSSNEIRVWFDTYANGSEIAQDNVRISAVKNSNETGYSGNGVRFKNGSGTTIDDVETNQLYPLTIKWTASSRTMEVFSGLSANYLITSAVIPTNDLSLTDYTWGWMGITGGANNYQYVTDVNYQVGPEVSSTSTDTTVVDGTSVTLNASYLSSETSPTTRWEYSTDGGSTWITTGVSTTSYTFTATRAMTQRKYRFYVESTAIGSTFSRATTPVTLRVTPPILRSETDTALTVSGTKYATLSSSNPLIPGTVSTMTLQAWVKPTTTCDGAVACTIISVNKSYMVQVVSGKIRYYLGSGSAWCDADAYKSPADAAVPGGRWTHISFVRVNANVKIYINGQLRSNLNSSCSPTTQAANSNAFFIGVKGANAEAFSGSIDEVKIWNTDRSANAASDMHSNETSTSGLLNYWNFNEGTGTVAYNDVASAFSTTDLTITDETTWDANVVSEAVVGPVYTTRTFYRSYITEFGGWMAPTPASRFTSLIVAGGGGGGYNSGGGGSGGGVSYIPTVQLTSIQRIVIGVGGAGADSTGSTPTSGGSSILGSITVAGGNPGGNYPASQSGGAGIVTSTGTSGAGGVGAPNNSTSGSPGSAGVSNSITGTSTFYSGGGGGGGWNADTGGGAGGAGGGGAGGVTNSRQGKSGSTNTGGGGGGGSVSSVMGGDGGSGVIIIRWITALKPTYTKPVNAYLNVGMTETFTTNVAQDSATAILTRTFRWESTTGGSNGTFSLIKQGTGAANASFSWVPTDTSTSGSNYLYRLIVTDSDTAGLFITDSSTAFATINKTLLMTGTSRINKAINVSKNETFTVSFGTSTYRVTMTPVIPGIALDTSTITSPVIRIAETATVGTYYETLTVTDSVSASVSIPLTINIVPPPTLLNTGEIITDNLVFNLEAGNSASLISESGTVTTGVTWNDLSGSKANATTGVGVNTGGLNGTSCSAPKYTSDNGGALTFAAASTNCYYASGFSGKSLINNYSVEAWFKTSATLPSGAGIVGQSNPSFTAPVSIFIINYSTSGLVVGFNDNVNNVERYANCPYTPTIGTWTHIAGTYDGTTLTTYINGASRCTATASWTPNSTTNSLGMVIGKGPAGGSDTAFPGSIASIRMYNKSLTAAQILSNFNVTKARFDTSNNSFVTPTKKYGDTLLETFTATSGSDTRTITFSVGDRNGIDWDTATVASQVKLTLQESLTVGSYIDTVTVTDALGQSTYLPFRMTTSKADSFTITMSAPTVITYNGSPITVYPRPTVTGLKWTDTATAVSRFSSALYTESTAAPTNADTYTVRGNTPTFTLGSIDNYLGVIYETSTATINKANQRPLNVFMYGGTVGSSYLIWLQGGNGTGEVTETLTGTASISGCAINNHYLTASEQKQGFCEVRVVKAGDQNYFAETQTVQLYFMAYINNQPTGQVGSGSTIGLNGATSLETSTVQPPSITSLSTLTISLTGGGTLTITGTGFTGTVTVKFWRNKTIDKTSGNGTSISVSASELNSIGATTGRVSVITAAGQAVSADTLTITP